MAREEKPVPEINLSCPAPISDYAYVLQAHGGGGRLMHQLIERLFLPAFRNPLLEARHDGALLSIGEHRLAFTTDSYTVHPLFFPGGDIGRLAVYGTVNDLAMCGARPLFLSASLILEEGLPMETLTRVIASMQAAAAEARVQIVTGDTKVVERGKGDGIFINTTGIGIVAADEPPSPLRVRPGDKILLSGDIGRHGVAIMAVREGLEFESELESDAAPLADLVQRLLDSGIEVHCMRDPTRGGLATALIEIAQTAGVQINLDESTILISSPVRAACEILGLDPLYTANEGRFMAILPEAEAEKALKILRADPLSADAALIGTVTDRNPGLVTLRTGFGSTRIVEMLSGEQLPRIC